MQTKPVHSQSGDSCVQKFLIIFRCLLLLHLSGGVGVQDVIIFMGSHNILVSSEGMAILWKCRCHSFALFLPQPRWRTQVASYGLQVKHLGTHLAEAVPLLRRLSHPPFSLNECGEGGEFETFTLDCPLYRGRITVAEQPKCVVLSDDPFDPVAYLQLPRLVLEVSRHMDPFAPYIVIVNIIAAILLLVMNDKT